MNIFDWIIIASIFILLYAYLLYPIFISLLSGIIKNPVKKDFEYQPEISVIISAYNEEKLIADCINSILQQNYPIQKISIYVGSDGSNDRTNEILYNLRKESSQLNVVIFDRVGKNKVINELFLQTQTGIVFFMDADIRIQSDELKILVSYLSDSKVGAVIAGMRSIGDIGESSGGFGEIIYQRIERIFRINESRISSTVNALGALYGVKRDLYQLLPNGKVADDFSPLLNVMTARKRVVFVEEAEVLEVRGKSTGDEFSRRIRASSSAMSSIVKSWQLLLPHYGWSAYFLWSHKILRWLSPIFLIIILVSTFFTFNNYIFICILIFQIFLYFGALIGLIIEKQGYSSKLLKIPAYAVNMNAGFLIAIFRFIIRKNNSKWER